LPFGDEFKVLILRSLISTVAVVGNVSLLACPAGLNVIQPPSDVWARQQPSQLSIGTDLVGGFPPIIRPNRISDIYYR